MSENLQLPERSKILRRLCSTDLRPTLWKIAVVAMPTEQEDKMMRTHLCGVKLIFLL